MEFIVKSENELEHVAEELQNALFMKIALEQRSDSRKTRKLALNRIIRELRGIIDRQAANLPQAEKELILSIAQKWKTCCSSSL
jgi:hypothetical protein